MGNPPGNLHQPGETKMDDEPPQDGARPRGQDAQDEAAEKRGDAFGKRLAKMDGAIESSHGQDGIGADKAKKGDDEQTAKEKLDAQEVETIGKVIKQFQC